MINHCPRAFTGILEHHAPIRTRQTLGRWATHPALASGTEGVEKLLSLVASGSDPLLVRQALGVLRRIAHPAIRESLLLLLPRIPDTLNTCLALQISQDVAALRSWSCHPLYQDQGAHPVGRMILCGHGAGLLLYWQITPPHTLDITLVDGPLGAAILTQGRSSGILSLGFPAASAYLIHQVNPHPPQPGIPLSQAFLQSPLHHQKAPRDKTTQGP